MFYVIREPSAPLEASPIEVHPFTSRESALQWAEKQCRETGQTFIVARALVEVAVQYEPSYTGAIAFRSLEKCAITT